MKRFLISFVSIVTILLMTFMIFAIISYATPTEKTFDLTINSKTISVILPDTLPEMVDTAMFAGEECYDGNICRQQFCLNFGLPYHDHVHFIYTDKGEVFALVWDRTLQNVHVPWKYIDGIPILTTVQDINRIIEEHEKPDIGDTV